VGRRNVRLQVRGVEKITVTDPKKKTGYRKTLDQGLLKRLKGQEFTAAELKQLFGYVQNTLLTDTQLIKLLEPVDPSVIEHYPSWVTSVEEKSTKWRVL
jgi:hypothetical protein